MAEPTLSTVGGAAFGSICYGTHNTIEAEAHQAVLVGHHLTAREPGRMMIDVHFDIKKMESGLYRAMADIEDLEAYGFGETPSAALASAQQKLLITLHAAVVKGQPL